MLGSAELGLELARGLGPFYPGAALAGPSGLRGFFLAPSLNGVGVGVWALVFGW